MRDPISHFMCFPCVIERSEVAFYYAFQFLPNRLATITHSGQDVIQYDVSLYDCLFPIILIGGTYMFLHALPAVCEMWIAFWNRFICRLSLRIIYLGLS